MTVKTSILEAVDNAVLALKESGGHQAIFLSETDFREFKDCVEPHYKKIYGALAHDEKMTKQGYLAILHRNIAVCLLRLDHETRN